MAPPIASQLSGAVKLEKTRASQVNREEGWE